MFKRICRGAARFIIKYNAWIIAAVLAAVFLGLFCVGNLSFENDMTYWVDKDSDLGRMPHYINEKFGSNTPLLVALACGDVFTYTHLNQLNTFSLELLKIPGVDDVLSLANVEDVVATGEGIRVKNLIDYPLEDDRQSLDSLKAYTLGRKFFTGRLVSADGKNTLVIIKPKFGMKADKLAWEVKRLAQEIFTEPGEKLYFGGNPFLLNSMAEIVFADFIFLIPLVSLLVMAVLFISFRTWRGVILPLLTVIFSGVLTMGIMALAGVPLNVMSSAIPVLLIAVGSAYGIHVLNNYYQNAGQIEDRHELVRRMMRQVGLPVLMAGLTTAVGFFSNVVADVGPIKTFGIFTAVGVMLAMSIALLFIPAVLLRLPVSKKTLQQKNRERWARFASFAAGFCFRYKRAIIIVSLVLGLGIFLFSFRITSRVDMLGYFSKDAEPQTASRFVNENFGGFNPLNIYLKGDLQNPDILKLCLMLEEKIKSYKNLGRPYSLADVVSELSHALTGVYTIPESKDEVVNLWFLLEGKKSLAALVTEDKGEGLVSVLLPSLDNDYLQALFSDLNAFIGSYGKNIKIMAATADNPRLQALVNLMLKNLLFERKIVSSDDRVQAAVSGLGTILLGAAPAIDKASLTAYLTSDEAEIPLSQSQGAALAGGLSAESNLDRDKIKRAVLKVLPKESPYTDEEIAALSRSIETIIIDHSMKVRFAALKTRLFGYFPGLAKAGADNLDYVLAPFFWKTMPVPAEAVGPSVRTTPLAAMEITGSAFLLEGIRQSIFYNQASSLALALLAVFLLNLLNFRSLRVALVSMVSIVFTLMVNFGIMGLANIPLDFVTAIIAGVATGTGIDYTIHFISRFKEELKSHQGNREMAYASTLATTGKAIIFNALSVGLGFAVLLASSVIPLRTAGLLLASTMFTSSISALTLLPAVLFACKLNLVPGKAGRSAAGK